MSTARHLSQVRALLIAVADPKRAPAMQAYMKSAMPFHGVASAKAKAVAKTFFATLDLTSEDAYRDVVLELWRGATRREERYLAVMLTRHRRGGLAHRRMTTLPIYEEMIVTGAWWDYVDELAAHAVGNLARAHREEMTKQMRAWSRDPNLWKRRTSILHQLRFREAIDLPLLEHCIEGSMDDKDFFARKAIGWALRQHARVDPKWVAGYVSKNARRLSGLSKREALKAQLASGEIEQVP